MNIQLKLAIDERSQDVYWNAFVKHGERVIVQCASPLFHPKNIREYEELYRATCNRVMMELNKEKDQTMLKHLLLNPEPNE